MKEASHKFRARFGTTLSVQLLCAHSNFREKNPLWKNPFCNQWDPGMKWASHINIEIHSGLQHWCHQGLLALRNYHMTKFSGRNAPISPKDPSQVPAVGKHPSDVLQKTKSEREWMTNILFPFLLTLQRGKYIHTVCVCVSVCVSVSDKNHYSNFLRSSAKRQSFSEVNMIKESKGEETMDKGSKGENGIWHESKEKEGESLLVGGNEFSCQGIFFFFTLSLSLSLSRSTLHIIM